MDQRRRDLLAAGTLVDTQICAHLSHPTASWRYRTPRGSDVHGWTVARPRAAHFEELDRMDWRHHALCRDEDPELFFPIGTTGPAAVQVEEAKVVCRRCPVVSDCLTWALDSGQDSGVWGGTNEDERRALTRRDVRVRVPAS